MVTLSYNRIIAYDTLFIRHKPLNRSVSTIIGGIDKITDIPNNVSHKFLQLCRENGVQLIDVQGVDISVSRETFVKMGC